MKSYFSKFQALHNMFESSHFIEHLFFGTFVCFPFNQRDLIKATASSLLVTDTFVVNSFAMIVDMTIQSSIFVVILSQFYFRLSLILK